jgi:superfamily I DNA and RNA helicase
MKSSSNIWWRRLRELDPDQQAAFQLPTDGNHLVVGPPGSGKTNILILRAQFISSTGLSNVRLIVYTRVLRNFIATGCGSEINFPSDQVNTFASWAENLIRERGGKIPPGIRDMEEPEARRTRLGLLEEWGSQITNYFDSLIVYEVQDFWPEEVRLLKRATPRLFFAGDAGQRLYDSTGRISAALEVVGGQSNELVLRHHYRIGPRICEVADRLRIDPDGDKLTDTEHYQDTQFLSHVDPHVLPSLDAQCQAATETIRTQLVAYPGDWIGVIISRQDDRTKVYEILNRGDLAGKVAVFGSDRQTNFDPDKPICIVVLQSAKGLEFRAIHWIGADHVPYYSREKAFTVITRARTAVDVYHTDPLHPELQAALTPITPPKLGLPE